MLSLLIVTIATSDLLPSIHVACYEDKILNWTSGINNYFREEVQTKFAFMIICGLMMDGLIIATFSIYVLYGTTWRIALGIALFEVIRFIIDVKIFYV
jgi:hypothetical protein